MNTETTVPPEFGKDLGYLGAQDIPHLMACLVGLGGEVFMLKAEVERLRRALQASGGVTPQSLEAAGADASFREWLQKEQADFGRSLLAPFVQSAAAASKGTSMPAKGVASPSKGSA